MGKRKEKGERRVGERGRGRDREVERQIKGRLRDRHFSKKYGTKEREVVKHKESGRKGETER
jgi:hypothetical protein